MIIAIDFDGTCVTHEYPNVGKDIGAVPVLKELVEKGHQLILWTMRSDSSTVKAPYLPNIHNQSGDYLTDAINWFKQNNIPLWGIQSNPEQSTWTTSPKAYAHLYIDDAALGCPLKQSYLTDGLVVEDYGRPYVDWVKVKQLLIEKGIL